MTPSRPKHKYNGWPYRVVGFVWEQTALGKWMRHLVRRYIRNGQLYHDEVVFVEQNDYFEYPFCMVCLSQNLEQLPHELYQWWHCRACGLDFRIV